MSNELKSSAQRVQDFLSSKNANFIVKELPNQARTAKEAALAIGCTVSQIAKSLIFKDVKTGDPILVIASGTNMVCTTKIYEATGLQLGKANANFVKDKVGYAIGGVPPIAHKENVITILDPDLKNYDVLWAAAGTPHCVFELKSSDLESLTSGQWVSLAV